MASRTQPQMSGRTQAKKPDNINTKCQGNEETAKTA